MGITGTPVELSNKNTRLVFGDYISTYKIDRSEKDETTVKIYYEGRLAPLHVLNDNIDDEFEELTEEHAFETKEYFKQKWARIEQAVGSEDRLQKITEDIIFHFNNRGLKGKAMIVTMSRRIAVRMYQIISQTKDAPEAAVIISSNQDYKKEIQNELDNKEIERRFKNPDDPLNLAIVCDMWLTGFDVPFLHTLYLDKPLKGHTLMQAIARVNRRYKDKEAGLIVDYIGVADNIKKALAIYASDIQDQAMIPLEELVRNMLDKYKQVKSFFVDIDYKDWKKRSGADLVALLSEAVNTVLTDKHTCNLNSDQKDKFLKLSMQLYKLFSLTMPHKDANAIKEDIEFFEGVRKIIVKNTIVDPVYITKETETAVRDLISKGIKAEGVIDIFAQNGKEKPDISILDEKFLADAKNYHYKNLTIEAIQKLLKDELRYKKRLNIPRFQSLLDMLEEIIEEYENNIINSSKVIERLIALAREVKKAEHAGENIGLSDEEMAFYDVLSEGKKAIKNSELKKLVKELVKAIKRDITIDWTNHEIIKSRIRANVRLVLLRNNYPYEEVDTLTTKVYEQAFYLYKDYQNFNVYSL